MESTKIAIMIEVTSRRMECTLLTPDFSQVPAVALHYVRLAFFVSVLFSLEFMHEKMNTLALVTVSNARFHCVM